jgi:endonuclease/exonuclease/phosphatase family metal-dependent hydrolase
MTIDVAAFRDVHAVVTAVRGAEPDVVAVLGAPRFLRWRSKRAALARQSGLVVATADRPGGVFLMTSLRAAVVARSFALLPLTPGGRRRSVVTAVVETLGARWRIAAVRLGPDAGERAAQSVALQSALFGPQAPTGPLIVAGDLGESPDGPLRAGLRDRLVDVTGNGGQAILAEPGLTVVAAESEPAVSALLAQ